MKAKRIFYIIIIFFIKITAIQAQVNHINFSAPKLYAVEAAPGHIAQADFNNDGLPDFLVSAILWGGGDILMSQSNGHYRAQTNNQNAEATMGAPGDFNKDGWIDYALATNQGIRVAINQKGQSWSIKTFFSSYNGCMAICIEDFDEDNDSDIAVAVDRIASSNQDIFLIENVNGQLTESSDKYTLNNGNYNNYLRTITKGDFNGDGKIDIVSSFTETKKISVILNNAPNGFNPPVISSVGHEAWMVVAKDFNADGKDDIAVGAQSEGLVSILLSNGTGNFQEGQKLNLTDGIYSINTADLDSDGDFDLFVNTIDNLFLSWQNNGQGSFTEWQKCDLGAYSVGYGLLSFRSYLNFIPVDLNNDNFPDLAGIFDGNQIGLVYNNGDGTCPGAQVSEFPFFALDNLTIDDYDENGLKDIIGFDGRGNVAVMYNTLQGQFTEFTELPLQPADAVRSSIYVGSVEKCKLNDLDNDGDLDFVAVYHRTGVVYGQLNSYIIRNDNDTFIETEHFFLHHEDSIRARFPEAWFSYNISPIAIADFNNDTQPDIVFTIGDTLYVFHNIGNVQFELYKSIELPLSEDWGGRPVAFQTYELFAKDMNNDGIIDLILNGETSIIIYYGDNSGSFQYAGEWDHPDPSGEPVSAKQAAIADFNADGHFDMVFAGGRLKVVFLFGNGNGGFDSYRSPAYSYDNDDIFVLQADNDEKMDVGIINSNAAWRGNSFVILRNDGSGFFPEGHALIYAIGDRPTKGWTADFNNDGLSDIVAQYDRKKIKIFINKSQETPQTSINGNSIINNNPQEFRLVTNYPNPFNSETIIRYDVSKYSKINISIYNIMGQLVKELINIEVPIGSYQVKWTGRDNNNQIVSSGIYICHYKTESYKETIRLLLIK